MFRKVALKSELCQFHVKIPYTDDLFQAKDNQDVSYGLKTFHMG